MLFLAFLNTSHRVLKKIAGNILFGYKILVTNILFWLQNFFSHFFIPKALEFATPAMVTRVINIIAAALPFLFFFCLFVCLVPQLAYCGQRFVRAMTSTYHTCS